LKEKKEKNKQVLLMQCRRRFYLKRIFGSNITSKRMPKKYKIAQVFGFPPFLKRINEPSLGFYTVSIRNLAFCFATR